jgi:CRP-like cAMP-binding protein
VLEWAAHNTKYNACLMKSFIDILNSDNSILKEELQQFKNNIQIQNVAKGQILQFKGEISDKSYFVKSGLLRSYFIDENFKEHIFMFGPEGWIISDFVSQTYKTPSEMIIEAIEDSEIEILSNELYDNLISRSQKFRSSDIEKLNKRIAVLQKRVIMLMSATAWERYQHFLDTYPDILQRVPQKMIASYLGITPEALSNLRSQMSKKK